MIKGNVGKRRWVFDRWLSTFLILFFSGIMIYNMLPSPSTPLLRASHENWSQLSDELRDSMQYAFQSYMRDAWKSDEYMPVKKRGLNTFGGRGLPIIDSLDTLFMMGLDTEFKSARHFVAHEFEFKGKLNVFENNVRTMGGLLSAYTLTKDPLFLSKAKMVGEVLLLAFQHRIPCGVIETKCPDFCGAQPWASGHSITVEVGTLSLEFVALSKFTGDTRWVDKITAINRFWQEHSSELLFRYINPVSEVVSGPVATIDSIYAYFLKLQVMTGDTLAGTLYRTFENYMAQQNIHGAFAKSMVPVNIEHTECFMGGMLILGQKYLKEGLALTETCARMYTTNPSGLACDAVTIDGAGTIHCRRDVYLLRPEVVESLFYAWRETRHPKWRKYAKDIWRAIVKWTRVGSGGFTTVRHVTRKSPHQMDKQEFWLVETLKYLWLIFQPGDPLGDNVLNTKGHILPLF